MLFISNSALTPSLYRKRLDLVASESERLCEDTPTLPSLRRLPVEAPIRLNSRQVDLLAAAAVGAQQQHRSAPWITFDRDLWRLASPCGIFPPDKWRQQKSNNLGPGSLHDWKNGARLHPSYDRIMPTIWHSQKVPWVLQKLHIATRAACKKLSLRNS